MSRRNAEWNLRDRLCNLVLPEAWEQIEEECTFDSLENKRRLDVILEESQTDFSDKKSDTLKVAPMRIDYFSKGCCCIS